MNVGAERRVERDAAAAARPLAEQPPHAQRVPMQWGDRLLGADRHSRIRVQHTLAASCLMLAGGLAVLYLGWVGIAPLAPVICWISIMLVINAGFYVAVRFGFTRGLRDPALTEPHMAYAMVQAALSYLLAGQARGAFLLAAMLVLTFGLFSLSTPRMWRMVALGLVAVSAAMIGAAVFAPADFDPQIERANFIVALISLPAMGMVAARLNRLRERLRSQKQALEQALQRIELLATRDELTGLVNRRQMLDLLAQQHQRSVRSGHSFCLAVLDIDHFKRINDSHGHPAGDQVLRQFGANAAAAIRLSDVLARWGGEEFLLMMPDTGASLARLAVERLRERTAALRVQVDGVALGVTLSAGVTEHRAGEPVSETIARADTALYAAKANGRNQVVAS